MGLSNYPPGVTGNEPQITGEWPCYDCDGAGYDEDEDGKHGCPRCKGSGIEPEEYDDDYAYGLVADDLGNRERCEGPVEQVLEDLRKALREERISLGELAILQELGAEGYIETGDVELLEAAGVPEHAFHATHIYETDGESHEVELIQLFTVYGANPRNAVALVSFADGTRERVDLSALTVKHLSDGSDA